MTIAAKLKSLRKAKRQTQEECATNIGFKRSTWSNYECGRRSPSLKELRRIAEYFGVGLDFFGIATQDEAFDVLTRAKNVFEDENISDDVKDQLYKDIMRLYLKMGEK